MLCTRRAAAARKHTATLHRLRLSRAVTPAENPEILGELTQDSPSWLSNISVRSALFEGQHAAQVRGTDRHATLFPHLQYWLTMRGRSTRLELSNTHPTASQSMFSFALKQAENGGEVTFASMEWSDVAGKKAQMILYLPRIMHFFLRSH